MNVVRKQRIALCVLGGLCFVCPAGHAGLMDRLGEKARQAKEKVEQTGKKVGRGFEKTSQQVKNKAQEAASKTKRVAQTGWRIADEAGQDIKRFAVDSLKETRETYDDAISRINKVTQDARQLGEQIAAGKQVKKALEAYLRENVDNIVMWTESDLERFNTILRKIGGGGVTATFRRKLHSFLTTYKQAPLRNQNVTVRRQADPISPQERAFRFHRDRTTSAAQKSLGIQNPYQISIAGSGGGMRAMLGYLGNVKGLEEIGVLDATTYASGLSGSTWFLSTWMQHNMSLHDIKRYILDRMTTTSGRWNILAMPNRHTIANTVDALTLRWLQDMNPGIVDVYGAIMGSYLMPTPNTQREYLSGQRKSISAGKKPMPLYTAMWYRGDEASKEYVEFTPYEVGIRKLGFIDTDGFGRSYKQGVSQDKAVPYSVGFCQGLWGSAFGVYARYVWNDYIKKDMPGWLQRVTEPVDKLFQETRAGTFQPSKGAQIPNFTYKLDGSPASGKETLYFADAGIDWMMNPVFPLYRDGGGSQAPQALFVFDFSSGSMGVQEVERLVAYARENNLAFPQINLKDPKLRKKIDEQTLTIFGKDQPDAPLVFYMPLINIDMNNYGTFKFAYSRGEAEHLIEKARKNVIAHKDEILQALRERGKRA